MIDDLTMAGALLAMVYLMLYIAAHGHAGATLSVALDPSPWPHILAWLSTSTLFIAALFGWLA